MTDPKQDWAAISARSVLAQFLDNSGMWQALIAQALRGEREACARKLERLIADRHPDVRRVLAQWPAAIRTRTDQEQG